MSFVSWMVARLRLPQHARAELIARGIEVVRPLVAKEQPSVSGGGQWRRSSRNAVKTVEGPQPDPKPRIVRKTPPDLRAEHRTFSAMLVKFVNDRYGGKASVVYRRAGIDRKLYSKIVSDNDYRVSRETAFQLAIGLQLTRPELDDFLRSAGMVLTPTLALDRAFIYCLENGIMNILDVNRIIVGAGLPELRLKF